MKTPTLTNLECPVADTVSKRLSLLEEGGRRSYSLLILCSRFCPNSCHHPGPCSHSVLCTRVLVAAVFPQPSSGARHPDYVTCSRRRFARRRSRSKVRQPPLRRLQLWMVSYLYLSLV